MQSVVGPIRYDLVLVGGGHSHVAVLKSFGMEPPPGVRLTLITRDIDTPYSGMLPGYVAGHYRHDEAHIDLRPLAQFARARLYHDEMIGLDAANRRVLCRRRPPVAYDFLSIDIGSAPSRNDIPGAGRALPVKPVDQFLAGWDEIMRRATATRGPFRIVVAGAGAGGVELTLALRYRLRTEAGAANADHVEFHLVTDVPAILPTHNARVRRTFERALIERGVRVHADHPVIAVDTGHVRCTAGRALAYDALIWTTNAAAPAWLKDTGLALAPDGFIAVNEYLQSTSHPDVFAAGDIATILQHPRPKAGVFAVRAGKPLARNLRHAAAGRPLTRFVPQRRALALISTGDKYAVASRGSWSMQGRWLWRWKDWIDRRFMRRYQELPAMAEPHVADAGQNGARESKDISSIAMRCGGCGSKVGAAVLSRVLARLPIATRDDIVIGLNDPDDAAVVAIPPGQVVVHTVDFFRALIDDAYLFGAIAANHSLSDLYAMGAQPQSALAIATLPYAPEAKVEQQLYELLSGALTVLNDAGCALVGGHTSEGVELAFGLSANGVADPNQLLRKGGLRPGDKLILTKALGTGTLFAADMRLQARGRWVEAAIESMLQPNRQAAEIVRAHGAHACTDVTGFGLLGHLVEMTRPSRVDAEIDLNAIPALDGALETLARGIQSSLAPDNVRLRRALRNFGGAIHHPCYPLLFDPQTSGGLLASVPAARADNCVRALRRAGYTRTTIIGEVQPLSDTQEPITLRI